MNVKELAPDMGHAGDFFDLIAVELFVPRIAISVKKAGIVFQIFSWPLALAVAGVLVERRRRR